MKQHQGFTLIELLVTLIIIAIVAMMGAPSFRNVMIGTQIDSNLNLIRSSLIYARSEAVTKSTPVSACMTTDNASCVVAGAANWGLAWIVFRDIDGDGVVDGDPVACADGVDDCVLRVYGPLEGGSTLIETNGDYVLTYSPRGQLMRPTANLISFQMRIENCGQGQEREIDVNRVGRVGTGTGVGCDA
jgi:type IV fimbrial biogenesis protein FimT